MDMKDIDRINELYRKKEGRYADTGRKGRAGSCPRQEDIGGQSARNLRGTLEQHEDSVSGRIDRGSGAKSTAIRGKRGTEWRRRNQEIRKECRNARMALSECEVEEASRRAAGFLLKDADYRKAETILAYIDTQQENLYQSDSGGCVALWEDNCCSPRRRKDDGILSDYFV